MSEPIRGEFWKGELQPVVDATLVEHIGGPNDGEFRRADDNGARPGGIYAPVNEFTNGEWRVLAKRFIHRCL